MFRADFLAFPLKPANFKARKRIRVGARLPFGKAGIEENILFNGRAVTLTGTEPNNTGVVESTIITASSGYSVTFDFGEGNDSVITGFKVTGRGIKCYGTSPTITKNIITNCTLHGIYGENNAQPIIKNNVITNNTSSKGGGLYNCDGPITNNTISGNIARRVNDDAYGGGLYNCDGPITNNTISGNTAKGGGYSHDAYGGGLYNCNGEISNNTISNNTAKADEDYHCDGYGGGLYNCDGPITNNTISGNTATGSEQAEGGGLNYCGGTIRNNTISGNTADGVVTEYGGGLYNCNGEISNNIITGNTASKGGALNYCRGTISNNTIIGNTASSGYGGGLYDCDNKIKNNIIGFNESFSGGAIYGSCNNSYNDFWMNEGGNFGGGATAGVGDIAVNPLFAVDGYWDSNDIWVDGDYHLKSEAGRWDPNIETWVIDNVTSFCIDAGDPCDSIQYEPNPNGGRINMGAYGGTVEASKSTGGSGPEPLPYCTEYPVMDFNHDCKVDFRDFALFIQSWLDCNLDPPSACWE